MISAASAGCPHGVRYLVMHHDWAVAIASGWVSLSVGAVVAVATDDNGLGLWTQLGVAGLIVVAIMFMLRRSDRREMAKDRLIHEIEAERIEDLKAQIVALQEELELARNRKQGGRP